MASIAIFSCALVILATIKLVVLDIFVLLVVYGIPSSPSDLSTVSGYYGPGVYWGWYLSSTSLLIRYVVKGTSIESSFRKTSVKGTRRCELDGDLIGSVGYVLFALGDFCRQVFAEDPSQLLAAVMVVMMACNFAIFVLMDDLALQAVWSRGDRRWTRFLPTVAFGTWLLGLILNFRVVLAAWEAEWLPDSSVLNLTSVIMAAGGLAACVVGFMPFEDRFAAILRMRLILLVLGSQLLVRWLVTPAAVMPASLYRIGDLDQASAFTVAIVVVLFSWRSFLLTTS